MHLKVLQFILLCFVNIKKYIIQHLVSSVHSRGTFSKFCCSLGAVCLAVFLKDDHIHGSPFVVSVYKEINYNEGSKKLSLGLDADGPGQFTCPYGVAISPLTGDIWVTDSGNEQDQIQVGGGVVCGMVWCGEMWYVMVG